MPTRKKTPLAETFASVTHEALAVMALADRRLTWIDMHDGHEAYNTGLVGWPVNETGHEPDALHVRQALQEATDRAGVVFTNGEALVKGLSRLEYALGQYRICVYADDRAHFGTAAVHARADVAHVLRQVMTEMRRALNAEV